MKSKTDYCTICKDTTKCKTCKKSPFRNSLKGLGDYESCSGGPDNLLIAIIGVAVIVFVLAVNIL